MDVPHCTHHLETTYLHQGDAQLFSLFATNKGISTKFIMVCTKLVHNYVYDLLIFNLCL